MNDSQELKPIYLPDELLSKVKNRVKHSEFDDASAYVAYVLEEVFHEVEDNEGFGTNTEVDEGQVEDRLKSLGYLDE